MQPWSSPVKMFLSSRQAGYSNRQQRLKLQGPPEESGRSKRLIFRCRRPNGQLPAHFDWADGLSVNNQCQENQSNSWIHKGHDGV